MSNKLLPAIIGLALEKWVSEEPNLELEEALKRVESSKKDIDFRDQHIIHLAFLELIKPTSGKSIRLENSVVTNDETDAAPAPATNKRAIGRPRKRIYSAPRRNPNNPGGAKKRKPGRW